MPLPDITLKKLHHRGKDQIGLYFDYDKELIAHTKKLNSAKWSATNKCWYVENNPNNLRNIFSVFKGNARINKIDFFDKENQERSTIKKLVKLATPAVKKVPDQYLNLLIRRRYSENTIKVYTHFFGEFINYFPDLKINELTEEHIRKFQDYMVSKRKVAISTQNQAINAIKFYYEKVIGGESKTYYIERPRKSKHLPTVLSEKQIMGLINETANLKHKCLIVVLYSSGLRIGELINLRKQDVLYDKDLIFVRSGKGRKDRTTLLAESTALIYELLDKVWEPALAMAKRERSARQAMMNAEGILPKPTDLRAVHSSLHGRLSVTVP